MADFNKILNGITGGLGVTGSLLGAYYNTPKALSNQQYLDLASLYTNQNYKASDIAGLMSQYNNRGILPVITDLDLYNPSQGELFGSMFGAGLGTYNAAKGLTNQLNELDLTKARELQDNEIPSQNAMNSDENLWSFENTQNMITDITNNQYDLGGALSTELNLLSGGLGIALNYAGIKNQQRKALEEADSYNAARLYAEQLNQHNFNNAVTDSKNNMFNLKALLLMANGGTLSTQGLNFPIFGNYREINEGGTHEENINNGVPQGLASDGQLNLVEEGEVIWNDYVFSDSRRKDKKHNTPDLKLPQELLDKYKDLKESMTFADAAKKLSKEALERPNDYISQNGLEVFLGDLRNAQEQVKQELEAKRMKRAINKMSPEELMLLQAMLSQGLNEGMFALGGHLFDGTKEKSNQMTDRRRGLLNQLILPQLLELASAYTGYNADDYNTTDVNPLIDFILSNNEDYDTLLKNINARKVLPLLQGELPDYNITNIDATNWEDLFNLMSNYTESMKRANTNYKYYADPKFMLNGMNVSALEKDDKYNKFTEYVLNNANNPNVQKYLHMLDERINTERGADKLFDENGNLKSDWLEIYRNRRTDDIGGIYHFFKDIINKKTGNRTIYRLNGLNVEVEDPEKLSKFLKEKGRTSSVEFDEEGNPMTTTYIDLIGDEYGVEGTELPEDEEITPLDETPRYAPVLGSILGSLQSLTEQPRDYSTNITPREATYTPIGDYLEYNPVDTQRYINAVNQLIAALNANIMNASGANKNAAIANMMFTNNQRQQNLAEILNQAELINTARKALVGEFNRGTNMANAQAYNATEQANLALNNFLLNQALQNAQMRYNVDNALDMAKSTNLSQLFDNLGAIGKENLAYNQANSNKALDYAAAVNALFKGISQYKG